MNSIYHWSYDSVDSSLYDHQVMSYGEASDGRDLGREDVLDVLIEYPLFPMPDNGLLTNIRL